MKTLILSFFVLTFFVNIVLAQSLHVSPETKLMTCDTVVYLDGKTADILFDKAKGWFIENKITLQGENKPDLIRGEYIVSYSMPMGQKQRYINSILVKIKDGAIKVVIDNMMTVKNNGERAQRIEGLGTRSDGTMRTGGMYQRTNSQIELKFRELITNLQSTVDKKSDF